jgi:hypothetical protein
MAVWGADGSAGFHGAATSSENTGPPIRFLGKLLVKVASQASGRSRHRRKRDGSRWRWPDPDGHFWRIAGILAERGLQSNAFKDWQRSGHQFGWFEALDRSPLLPWRNSRQARGLRAACCRCSLCPACWTVGPFHSTFSPSMPQQAAGITAAASCRHSTAVGPEIVWIRHRPILKGIGLQSAKWPRPIANARGKCKCPNRFIS